MPTATLKIIYCVQAATGTDIGVNNSLARALPAQLLPSQLGSDPLGAIAGVVSAIDAARSDPDDLYVTTNTEGGRDNAIWPGPGRNASMQSGQSQAVNIPIPFTTSLNVSLWDYDSGSDDDLLGSITILDSDKGSGDIGKRAYSQVEGSAYYVVYRVD